MSEYRTETDSLGDIQVPTDALFVGSYTTQTHRLMFSWYARKVSMSSSV